MSIEGLQKMQRELKPFDCAPDDFATHDRDNVRETEARVNYYAAFWSW